MIACVSYVWITSLQELTCGGVNYRNTNNDQYKISTYLGTLILITYHKVNNWKCPEKTFIYTGSNYKFYIINFWELVGR